MEADQVIPDFLNDFKPEEGAPLTFEDDTDEEEDEDETAVATGGAATDGDGDAWDAGETNGAATAATEVDEFKADEGAQDGW